MEGDGDVEPEALDEALRRSTAVNPGAALRIEDPRGGAEPRWVRGPEPTLTVVDAPTWTGDRDGDDAPFLLWPLDASQGPTCELVRVRGAAKTYLIFRALHAVMDGQGTLAWVKDVMRCLRGETPLGHPSTLDVDQLMREVGTSKRASPEADALHPFGRASETSEGRFHWRRFTVDRALDAAVTGRIAVRLAEEARRHGEGKVRINLPTDLRYLRPQERSTGNLFSALFIDVPPGASADMIGLKVMTLLYKKEGTKPVGLYAGDGELGSLAAHRVKLLWDMNQLHATGLYAFTATLSHLGRIEGAELSGPGFAATGAYFVPLVGDSGCVLSVNGFGGHTEVCVGLSDRFTTPAGSAIEHLAALIRGAVTGDP